MEKDQGYERRNDRDSACIPGREHTVRSDRRTPRLQRSGNRPRTETGVPRRCGRGSAIEGAWTCAPVPLADAGRRGSRWPRRLVFETAIRGRRSNVSDPCMAPQPITLTDTRTARCVAADDEASNCEASETPKNAVFRPDGISGRRTKSYAQPYAPQESLDRHSRV